MIASLQCVRCVSLNAVSDSNELCIITNFCVHCVECQFGTKPWF